MMKIEKERLQALYELGIMDTPQEACFDRIVDLTARVLKIPMARLGFLDDKRQWFKSKVGITNTETTRGSTFCDEALRRDLLYIPDTLLDQHFANFPQATKSPQIRFYAGVAIAAPNGLPVGTLCIMDVEPRSLNKEDLDLLKDLGKFIERELQIRHERIIADTLQVRLQHFRSLLTSIPDSAIIIDDQGIILMVNPATEQLFGYAKEEMIGQNISMLMDGTLARQHDSFLKHYLRTGEAKVIGTGRDLQAKRSNGELFHIHLSIGEVIIAGRQYFFGYIRDMEDLRKSQRQLELDTQKLELAASIGQIGYWQRDVATQVDLGSDELYSIFGMARGTELPDREKFFNMIHVDDREVVKAQLLNLKMGSSFDVEFRLFDLQGEIKYVNASWRVILDKLGKVSTQFGILQDISNRKRLSEALHLSEDRLIRSQSYSNIGSWDWNIITGDLHWSERIAVMFGGEEGELETSYENFINAIHPNDREAVQKAVDQCVNEGKEYNIEHRVIWPNGVVYWLLEKGGVQRDADGNALRMLGVVQDITRRKLMEEELLHARQEAERANNAKSQFLATMSHELRTPLNGILGFAQLLNANDKEPLSEIQQQSVGQIQTAGNHLLEVINEVLDLSKIESGDINLHMEPLPLRETLNESLSLIAPAADEAQITIEREDDEDFNSEVYADRTRLKQVLLNVLSNAVKYNRKKGSITLNCRKLSDSLLRISITDTGIGLTQEQQAQLFQSYNRLGREQETIEGTGIGLVITKRIVEAMDGGIGVESIPGEGSTFWVDLHIARQLSKSLIPEVSAPVTDNLQIKHKPTILYIEDNPVNIVLAERVIGVHLEAKLITAHTGAIGFELAEANQPDLIILDLGLPDMNGEDVFKLLQASDKTHTIPVLAFSADAHPEDIKKTMSLGFTNYLTKPLIIHEFIEAIKNCLYRK